MISIPVLSTAFLTCVVDARKTAGGPGQALCSPEEETYSANGRHSNNKKAKCARRGQQGKYWLASGRRAGGIQKLELSGIICAKEREVHLYLLKEFWGRLDRQWHAGYSERLPDRKDRSISRTDGERAAWDHREKIWSTGVAHFYRQRAILNYLDILVEMPLLFA